MYSEDSNGMKCTVAQFEAEHFRIEIFGKHIPTKDQEAYRHMIAEYKILNINPPDFRLQIKKLKSQGFKTEPAFAKLLGLEGNPYEALLKINI